MKKKIIFSIIMAFFLSLSFVCGTAFFVDDSSNIFENQGTNQDEQDAEVKNTPSGDWKDYGANLEVGNQINISGSTMTINIYTANELAEFAKCVNNGSKIGDVYYYNASVYLQRDINLSAHYWTPIGSRSGKNNFTFRGYFNGNDHSIVGVFINKNATELATNRYQYSYGLFGNTLNANIRNLTIGGEFQFVKYSNESDGVDELHIGSFVGNAKDTTLANCYSYVEINVRGFTTWNLDYIYAGGLLGYTSNCFMSSCGYFGEEIRFYCSNADAYFDLWDCSYFGGLIGYAASDLTIIDSHNYSNIKIEAVTDFYVGGLVSIASSYGIKEIMRCSNFGDITIQQWKNIYNQHSVGGIIGTAVTVESEPLIISDCVNYGDIKNTNATIENIGGIIGSIVNHSLIYRCLNHGTINVQANNVGGIVGKLGGSEWHMGVLGIGSWTEYYSHYLLANCINAGKVSGGSFSGKVVGRITTDSSDLVNNVFKNNYFTDSNNPIGAYLNHDTKSVTVSLNYSGYKYWRESLYYYSFLNDYNNWYYGGWSYNNDSYYRSVGAWNGVVGTHKMYEEQREDEDGETWTETLEGTNKTWFMSPIVNLYFDSATASAKGISQTNYSLLVPSSAVAKVVVESIQLKSDRETVLNETDKENLDIKESVRFSDKGSFEWKSKYDRLDSKKIYFLKGVNYAGEFRYKQLFNLSYNTKKSQFDHAEMRENYNSSWQGFSGITRQTENLYVYFSYRLSDFNIKIVFKNLETTLNIKTRLLDGKNSNTVDSYSSDYGKVKINGAYDNTISLYYKGNIKYIVTPKLGYQFAGIAYNSGVEKANLLHGFEEGNEPLGVFTNDKFNYEYEYQDEGTGQIVFLFKKVDYKISISHNGNVFGNPGYWTDFSMSASNEKFFDFEVGYRYTFALTNLKSNNTDVTLSDGDCTLCSGVQPQYSRTEGIWYFEMGKDETGKSKTIDPFGKLSDLLELSKSNLISIISVNEFTIEVKEKEAIKYEIVAHAMVNSYGSKDEYKESDLGGTVTLTRGNSYTVESIGDYSVEFNNKQGYGYNDIGYFDKEQNYTWDSNLIKDYISKIKDYNIEGWNNSINIYYFFSVGSYTINLDNENGEDPTFLECSYKNGNNPYYFAPVAVKAKDAQEGYRYIGLYCGENLLTLNQTYKFANNGKISSLTITAKYEEYKMTAGDLTKTNGVYEIKTSDDLIRLSQMVNAGTTFENCLIRQTADIDMSEVIFNPIGSEKKPFKGVYDGNYHIISNLQFVGGDANGDKILNIGLFGYTDGATIKNLTIKDCTYTGFGNVGAVVAVAKNTTFSYVHTYNCSLTTKSITYYNIYEDEIDGNYDYTLKDGNKIPELNGVDPIKNAINSRENFGGIAGQATNCSFFAVSCNNVSLNGCFYVGGLVGKADSGNFDQCYVAGSVTGDDEYYDLVNSETIKNCYTIVSTNGKDTYNHINADTNDNTIWIEINGNKVLKVFYWC